jgi:branched-chain amino acid transport system ATP-binding protein
MKPEAPVLLETQNLSRYFGGLKAVDAVNLKVREGHFHSIIGPNGAGKTTLFNLLSSTLKPTEGRVLLRGKDITDLPSHRMSHLGIGRSFQITNIFPTLTVFENVRLAAQAIGQDNFRLMTPVTRFSSYQERTEEALAETDLIESAHLPAATLNHGDKRKLELAILLAQNPSILLLDEPTAGLASETVPGFMALIDRVREKGNKTVVLVEHNMNVVMSLSDRITVMHQGRLLAEGTPSEVTANEDVQKAYLGELYTNLTDLVDAGPPAAAEN